VHSFENPYIFAVSTVASVPDPLGDHSTGIPVSVCESVTDEDCHFVSSVRFPSSCCPLPAHHSLVQLRFSLLPRASPFPSNAPLLTIPLPCSNADRHQHRTTKVPSTVPEQVPRH
jgi:hypothetical protein